MRESLSALSIHAEFNSFRLRTEIQNRFNSRTHDNYYVSYYYVPTYQLEAVGEVHTSLGQNRYQLVKAPGCKPMQIITKWHRDIKASSSANNN